MSDNDTPPLTRQQQKRIQSLENKIAYWTRYLADSRTSIMRQYPDERINQMKPERAAHWLKAREEALARVDELEARRLAPMEEEYRQLLGLD